MATYLKSKYRERIPQSIEDMIMHGHPDTGFNGLNDFLNDQLGPDTSESSINHILPPFINRKQRRAAAAKKRKST